MIFKLSLNGDYREFVPRLRGVIAVLLVALGAICLPSLGSAQQTGYMTCIEDGGTAQCKDPDQGPQNWNLTVGPLGYFPSADAATAALNAWGAGVYCSYSANHGAVTGPTNGGANGAVYQTTVSWSGTTTAGVCGVTTPEPFSGSAIIYGSAPLSCNKPWQSALSVSYATASHPLGYCWQPTVQPCPTCNARPAPAVGNPIDPAYGNKLETDVDYPGTGAGGLSFTRYYNYAGTTLLPGTNVAFGAALGQGWTHSYQRQIALYPNGYVRALRPDGNHRVFLMSGGSYQLYGSGNERLVALANGTGWQYIDGNDTVETYDPNGILLSIVARNGQTLTMTYSTVTTPPSVAPAAGYLITVMDSFGHQLGLAYNSSGQLATMTDPAGGITTYSIAAGVLTTVAFPDLSSKSYIYNESAYTQGTNQPYALTGIVDENGVRYTTFGYNSQGQAISTSHAGGVDQYTQVIGYVPYYGSGSTSVTDPLGAVRNYSYWLVNGVVRFYGVDNLCPQCTDTPHALSFDANGNVASKTDFNGYVTNYAFDLTRNLETSRTEAAGTARARTITTAWNASFQVPSAISVYAGGTATGTPLRTTSYTYDGSGNVLTKTVTDPSISTSRTWTYTYNSFGQVLTLDGPRTDVSDVTTTTYYACSTGAQCGQIQNVTDAVGNVTTYNTYNAYGQPLTITDPNGVVTTLTYDARQRLTSRKVGTELTSFAYYPTGLLQKVTQPDGSYIQYTYDPAHRLTVIQDGLGNSIHYTLDNVGNRTAQSSYDPSNVLSTAMSRVYNSINQLSKLIGSAGTAAVTTAFGYDNNGNQTTVAAPLARNTTNSYDELNRLSQVTDPASGITLFGYDANDNLLSVKDPISLATTYQYNGLGDLLQVTSPATGISTSTYDSGGNLKTNADARGLGGTYSYDALNRVTHIAYGDQTLTFGYDAGTNGKGRLTSAGDALHTLSWQYDGLGRVVSKTQVVAGVTRTVGYTYTNGQLTTVTTPSGQAVGYSYTNGRITGITVNGAVLLSGVTYEPFGLARAWTWGNSVTELRMHDTDGNPSQITGPESTSYAVDSAFRIQSITNSSNPALSWTYGYDLLDRLTSGSASASALSWTLDGDGNRQTQGGAAAPTYTAKTITFSYNNRGRLASVTPSGTTATAYTYNAVGQRIEKSGPGGTTLFVYDEAGHLLGEYSGTGALIQETVWLGDLPVATLRPNGTGVLVYYVHADHLGAPRSITQTTNNAIVWRWDNDPYGAVAPNQNPTGLGTFVYNVRDPGQYFDAETALSYNYFRDYDPQVGRYVESDPIGLMGGMNTYGYVSGNPVGLVDPSGENPIGIPLNSVPIPLPGWILPAARAAGVVGAVAGAGKAGWDIGSYIYPHIATPLGDIVDRVCSDNAQEKLRKHCQALKDSILNTCYRLPPRKRMACYEAANTAFRQCMGFE